jgi:hypothetical protein
MVSDAERGKESILLSFVGNRDPYAVDPKKTEVKSDGSILSICDHSEVTPHRVYLFPSADTTAPVINGKKIEHTEKFAEEVKGEIKERIPNCNVHVMPLEVNDATDFTQISEEFDRKMVAVIDELTSDGRKLEDYAFHFNCSSGTQQMIALGYVFVNSGRIPGIVRWQCKDPKFVPPGEPRTKKILGNVIEEKECKKRIMKNLEKLAYGSIVDDCGKLANILEDYGKGNEREKKAHVMGEAFKAYILMDSLNYKGAYKIFKDMRRDINAIEDECARLTLESQKQFLDDMANPFPGEVDFIENAGNLADLYFNMHRSFKRGAYADVLARFWRMGEGAVYFRLTEEKGITPRKLHKSVDKVKLGEIQKYYKCHRKHLNDFITFKEARSILECVFKDKAILQWRAGCASGRTLDALINTRNDSIVAHGMRRVNFASARKCLVEAKHILTKLVSGAREAMANYPFKEETIKDLVIKLLE